ncbi:MAG: ABC transporter permease [Ktedonobacterales bacterium]|jgi:ABC-type transport system involved in multi-copper enzyme maturation permease subunit
MATTITGASARTISAHAARPSFLGLMRGEWLKLSRQWTFWIMLGLMVVGYILFSLILAGGGNLTDRIHREPAAVLYTFMQSNLFLLRVFWGMMVIILTARLIGMEYSSGTIRVVLARGVGRLQLLFAKLSVIALVAFICAALLELFATICGLIVIEAVVHNLDVLNSATATFWSDTRAYMASVAISLIVSILMAAAVTTVTRSLAAGLSVSIAWFPVDNFSILLLVLGDRLTHWDFWSLVSGDFLGLNLNAMPEKVLSSPSVSALSNFLVPLTPVTAAHTFLVAGIYAAIFLVVMVVMTALPDVKE